MDHNQLKQIQACQNKGVTQTWPINMNWHPYDF